jgi:hypothetical protein
LDNLILQSRDSQQSYPAIRLWDVHPLGRLGPVRSAMNSSMQIVDPLFKLHRVVTPRFTIDSRRNSLLQFQEAGSQEFRCDVVQ